MLEGTQELVAAGGSAVGSRMAASGAPMAAIAAVRLSECTGPL